MNRRAFSVALTVTLMLGSGLAHALEIRPYDAATLASLQAAGKPVAVHFHADWCPTCVNQKRSLEQLKAGGQLPGMTVLVADFDKERDLKRQHKVRSQSVVIVFKGAAEVARVAGETQPEPLRIALAKAL
jgi:thioredoxin-like negative regulator of GroEL